MTKEPQTRTIQVSPNARMPPQSGHTIDGLRWQPARLGSEGPGGLWQRTPGRGAAGSGARLRKGRRCFSLFLFIYPLNPEAPVAVCAGKVLPRVTSCLWPPWAWLSCQPCAGGTPQPSLEADAHRGFPQKPARQGTWAWADGLTTTASVPISSTLWPRRSDKKDPRRRVQACC